MSVLGDDDAFTRELPDVVQWMREGNIDMLMAWDNSTYYWPDIPDPDQAGTYTMYAYTGELVEYDSESLLQRSLRVFGYRSHSDQRAMPCVYRGIVRRSYLQQIAKRAGRPFAGYTPDYYCSLFLATIVQKTHWVDFPLFAAGVCAASNSANGLSGRTTAVHTREYASLDWPDIVPNSSIIAATCAESLVRALRDAGRTDLLASVKWPDLYLLCMYHEPALWWRNLRRYWSVSGRVLGQSRVQRSSHLAMGLARRVRDKFGHEQTCVEPAFATPRRQVFERFSAVRDTTELMVRQADALSRQRVVPPWRVPSPQAAVHSVVAV